MAYLSFASVYRSFGSLGDFEREIETLRAAAEAREAAGGEPVEAATYEVRRC